MSDNIEVEQETLEQLRQRIHDLEEQWREATERDPTERMIRALQTLTCQRQEEFVVPTNPVLHCPYGDHPPPAGQKDLKCFNHPEPFSGYQDDARPFLQRLQTMFAMAPNAYRLTHTHILAACSLITKGNAKPWAEAVSKAITENNANEYYTDEWAIFQSGFIGPRPQCLRVKDALLANPNATPLSHPPWAPRQLCRSNESTQT